MKFTLEIDCDNAAFFDGYDDEAMRGDKGVREETTRILRKLADEIEDGEDDQYPALDLDGHRVGTAVFIPHDDHDMDRL